MIFRHTFTENAQRLDKALADLLHDFSRSRLQTAIDEGVVLLNGQPTERSLSIKSGDTIEIELDFFTRPRPAPEDISLDILFEDEYLLIINKPAGMTVHPDASSCSGTLVNAMLNHCKTADFMAMADESDRPGIVHRLDKDTSGAIVVAKSRKVQDAMKLAFQEHRIHKWYLAIIRGEMQPQNGTINLPIGPSPVSWRRRAILKTGGKEAVTEYETLRIGKKCSLVKIRLRTGRTHQIRVHFSHLGHPIIGDALYGGKTDGIPRQMLHSWHISFIHPIINERIKATAPPPDDFRTAALDI